MRELTSHRSRLAGMALVAGGILSIAGYVITGTVFGDGDDRFTRSLWAPLYSIALVGAVLTVLGLPAILAAHRDRAARLTLVGYVGTLTTLLMLNVGEGVIEGFVKPYLVTHGGIPNEDPTALNVYFGVAFLFLIVGMVSLGMAVIRANVFPRWTGVLIIVAIPFGMFGSGLPGPLAELGDYLLFIPLIAIGWAVAQPARSGRRVAVGTEATA
jgi:hypothetical protein